MCNRQTEMVYNTVPFEEQIYDTETKEMKTQALQEQVYKLDCNAFIGEDADQFYLHYSFTPGKQSPIRTSKDLDN